MENKMKVSSDASTLVTDAYYYIPIDHPDARNYHGAKCILINKNAGVGYFGILNPKDPFATHFAPVPKFRPESVTGHSKNDREIKRSQIQLSDYRFNLKEGLTSGYKISCLFHGSSSELMNFKIFLGLRQQDPRRETGGFAIFTFQGKPDDIKKVFDNIVKIKHSGWSFMKEPYNREKNCITLYKEFVLHVEKVS